MSTKSTLDKKYQNTSMYSKKKTTKKTPKGNIVYSVYHLRKCNIHHCLYIVNNINIKFHC